MQVAVVGAGITGLATAWALTQAGMTVTLLERGQEPAQGASAQNGAQLSYAFVAPLASPATLRQIPSLLLDPQSPLKFRPGWSPGAWRWCAEFLLACRQGRAEETTRALLSLGELSRERFAAWRASLTGNPIEFSRNGKLVVYRSEKSWQGAQAQVRLQAAIGPAQELCSAAECLTIEPALITTDAPITGGVFTPSEEVADCAAVCATLLEQLSTKAGFRLMRGTEVLGFRADGNRVQGMTVRDAQGTRLLEADAFVVANGVDVARLMAPMGVRVPVTPLKGYSIDVAARHLQRVPSVSITDAAAKVVFAPLGSGDRKRLRVAGMAELVGPDLRIDTARITQLKEATHRLFGLRHPNATIDLRPWAGLRPATPTGLPCIGRSRRHANLFVNAGQGALGFTLAFGSAAMLLDDLQGAGQQGSLGQIFKTGLLTS